jgi:uncharacterized membrane protein YphA (DoxX/SURF4 family)
LTKNIFSLMRCSVAVLFVRIIVGGFFVIAGAAKLGQPAVLFLNQIESYGILPHDLVLPLAHVLPWLEIFSGLFFLLGLFSRWALLLLGVQLAFFSVAISVAMFMGTAPEDCGCLPGVSETPTQALARDLIMIALLALSFRFLPGAISIDRWLESNDSDEGQGE